jgi:hypothetical protein
MLSELGHFGANWFASAFGARFGSIDLQPYAHIYESPSFVKKERIIRASVNLPFVYPSIGVSLAPVGCFEVALAAPSGIRAQGPVSIRARQHQHGITVACGVLSILSFEAL